MSIKAIVAGVCLILMSGAAPAVAATEEVIFSFGGRDGAAPVGRLTSDASGDLFGVTLLGGTDGSGVVFELSPPQYIGGTWTQTVLHNFKSGDLGGYLPDVTMGSDGVLYGTTPAGGANGLGRVFSLAPPSSPGGRWTFAALHDFAGGANDGAEPYGIVMGPDGALYGGTPLCQPCKVFVPNFGVVYRLVRSGGDWGEQILYNAPIALPLIGPGSFGGHFAFGSDGALYGTATLGPSGDGNDPNVWRLSLPEGGTPQMSIIYNGPINGDVVFGSPSTIFTQFSGNPSWVVQLTVPSSGATWTANVLQYFSGLNGRYVNLQPLVLTRAGVPKFFGTTQAGGTNDRGNVFALRSEGLAGAWDETILHNFTEKSRDGVSPVGGVTALPDSTHPRAMLFYGVTGSGGKHKMGAVYQIAP